MPWAWKRLEQGLAHIGIQVEDVTNIVVTHAHLDHSGYLPLLVKNGFQGRVHATSATCDLASILLPDSGHIQEEDAFFANRHGFSKHAPAVPLYTKQEAVASLKLLHAEKQGQWFEPIAGWKARFQPAGHILGAASLLLDVGGRRVLFSGDLGRPDDPLMNPPEPPPQADTVLIESTYGDRQHPAESTEQYLAKVINETLLRHGITLVPSFAVGRAQLLMYYLYTLKRDKLIPASTRGLYLAESFAIQQGWTVSEERIRWKDWVVQQGLQVPKAPRQGLKKLSVKALGLVRLMRAGLRK